MRKSPTKYSEEFKLSVLRDYYSSGMSKRKCARKYGLCNPTLLSSWQSKYGEKTLSLPSEEEYDGMARRSKEEYREENASLRKRVREVGEGACVLAFGDGGARRDDRHRRA